MKAGSVYMQSKQGPNIVTSALRQPSYITNFQVYTSTIVYSEHEK